MRGTLNRYKSSGGVTPATVLSLETVDGVPTATIQCEEGYYAGVRFLDMGGGSKHRFSHAPSGLSTLQATEDAIDQGEAPHVLITFGPGHLGTPYILGALRSSATSTTFTSDQDTTTTSNQTPSARIHASKDRAEAWQGARWVVRDDGTFELDTSESGRPVKMLVGEHEALRISHARRDNEGNIEETHTATERVFLAVTMLAWINSTLITRLNALSEQVAALTTGLQAAATAQNAAPAAGRSVAFTEALGASSASLPIYAHVPTEVLDESVLSAAIKQSAKSVKEEA